ncbi:ABC transporter ATP-binding protein, partial [Enterococcus faecium]
TIRYKDKILSELKKDEEWEDIRGKEIATFFQDPKNTLKPNKTIGEQITERIIKHQKKSAKEAKRLAVELMEKTGIPNAAKRYDEYPFQYSGGMRQRIVIAIALACRPKILICDEPTTALDVTIQAQILELIKELQEEYQFTTIFITHDLGVAAAIADKVAVMYAGQIIESGTGEEIFYDPKHPYTWRLLSSLPQFAQKGEGLYSSLQHNCQ